MSIKKILKNYFSSEKFIRLSQSINFLVIVYLLILIPFTYGLVKSPQNISKRAECAGGCGPSACCRDWEVKGPDGCCHSTAGCGSDSDCEIGKKCVNGSCEGSNYDPRCGGSENQCDCSQQGITQCRDNKQYHCGNDCCWHYDSNKDDGSCGANSPTNPPVLPSRIPNPPNNLCPVGCCGEACQMTCPSGQACDIPNGACLSGKSCNPQGYGFHKSCSDNKCVNVSGSGTDTCTSDSYCQNNQTIVCTSGQCCGQDVRCNVSGTSCNVTDYSCGQDLVCWPNNCCSEGKRCNTDGSLCNVNDVRCTSNPPTPTAIPTRIPTATPTLKPTATIKPTATPTRILTSTLTLKPTIIIQNAPTLFKFQSDTPNFSCGSSPHGTSTCLDKNFLKTCLNGSWIIRLCSSGTSCVSNSCKPTTIPTKTTCKLWEKECEGKCIPFLYRCLPPTPTSVSRPASTPVPDAVKILKEIPIPTPTKSTNIFDILNPLKLLDIKDCYGKRISIFAKCYPPSMPTPTTPPYILPNVNVPTACTDGTAIDQCSSSKIGFRCFYNTQSRLFNLAFDSSCAPAVVVSPTTPVNNINALTFCSDGTKVGQCSPYGYECKFNPSTRTPYLDSDTPCGISKQFPTSTPVPDAVRILKTIPSPIPTTTSCKIWEKDCYGTCISLLSRCQLALPTLVPRPSTPTMPPYLFPNINNRTTCTDGTAIDQCSSSKIGFRCFYNTQSRLFNLVFDSSCAPAVVVSPTTSVNNINALTFCADGTQVGQCSPYGYECKFNPSTRTPYLDSGSPCGENIQKTLIPTSTLVPTIRIFKTVPIPIPTTVSCKLWERECKGKCISLLLRCELIVPTLVPRPTNTPTLVSRPPTPTITSNCTSQGYFKSGNNCYYCQGGVPFKPLLVPEKYCLPEVIPNPTEIACGPFSKFCPDINECVFTNIGCPSERGITDQPEIKCGFLQAYCPTTGTCKYFGIGCP